MMIAYCVRCGAKREMQDVKVLNLKNGKHVLQGTCPACGHRMFSTDKEKDSLGAERNGGG